MLPYSVILAVVKLSRIHLRLYFDDKKLTRTGEKINVKVIIWKMNLKRKYSQPLLLLVSVILLLLVAVVMVGGAS